MAGRQSKRLTREEPEICSTSYECFICHNHEENLSSRSRRLSCCGNFVHKRCQQRWEMEGQNANCGMCRRPLNTAVARGQQQTVQVTLPTEMIDHQAISNEVMAMSRDQIIARLRALLDSPALEQQLMMVRIYYFLFHVTLCKKIIPFFIYFRQIGMTYNCYCASTMLSKI